MIRFSPSTAEQFESPPFEHLLGCGVFLVITVGFLNPTQAQESVESIGPDGGFVRQIIAQEKMVYAAGRAGLIRSSDEGAQWTTLMLPAAMDEFFVSARDPRIVYMIGESGGIFRSHDSGETWKFVAAEPGIRPIFLDPDDPDVVWGLKSSLYNSGLHKSTDGGTTWMDVNPGGGSQTGTRAWIDPHAPNHAIAVVSCCGDVVYEFDVYVTDDGGRNWTRGAPHTLESVSFHPQRPNEVLAMIGETLIRSMDGGLSWEEIAAPPGEVVVWSPNDPAVLYSFMEDADRFRVLHVFRSANLGRSWTPIGELEPAVAPRPAAVAFPSPAQMIIGVFPHAFWQSDDGGSSWQISNEGAALTSVYDLEVDDDLLFAGVEGLGILRSTDHGSSWTSAIPNPSSGGLGDQVRIAGQKVFSNVLPGHLYDNGNWGATGGLAVSDDGGRSWEYRRGMKRGPRSFDVASDGSTLYGEARLGSVEGLIIAGLIKSTDGGRSWHELSFGELESTVNSIEMVQIDPGNPERVFVLAALRGSVDMDVLLGSFDGGSSWERLAENVEMFEQSPANPDVIYYVTRNRPSSEAVPQLYHSTNSGRSWAHRGPLPDSAGFFDVVSSPDNAERLFGATMTGEIVESSDAGKTWTILAGPLPSAWTEIDVATTGSIQLFGTTYTSGVQRLEVDPISETGTKNETSAQHALNTYPNPSLTSVHLTLDLQTRGGVTLKLYNVLGQHVSTLFQDRRLEAGHHEFTWDGRDHQGHLLPNGLYFVTATHSDGTRFTAVQTIAR